MKRNGVRKGVANDAMPKMRKIYELVYVLPIRCADKRMEVPLWI